MPNLYARATALPNVCGRVDYISNPARQENLLAFCDGAADLLDGQFWKVLAKESQQAFDLYGQKSRLEKNPKTGELEEKTLSCCQGREVHIALSNALLERMEADEIAQILVDEFQEKLQIPVAAAIHKNKKQNNLHAHIILPERQLLGEPVIKVAERNLFFDAQGKRRYKKSEILDENKQLLPGCRIVKKGEVYEQRYFSAVDPEFSYKSWLADLKTNVILPLRNGKLRGDIDITEYDPSTGKLAQRRWPKGAASDIVENCEKFNQLVKEFNQLIDSEQISLEEALAVQTEVNHLGEKTAVLEAKVKEFKEREQQRRLAAEEEEKRRLAEEEEKKWYSRSDWLRDAVSPYKVYRYDRDGRKRTIVELILILAINVIRYECDKRDIVEPVQRRKIYAKRDWKLQQMVDSIRIAREEDIGAGIQVEDRVKEVGAELSRARKHAERLTDAKEKMDLVMQSMQDYKTLQQKCEKILAMPNCLDKDILMASEKASLEQYRNAKADVYQAGVHSPEGLQAFMERYSSIEENLQQANKTCDELKERYRNLRKLEHQLRMAEYKQYCYDTEWEPEQDPSELEKPVEQPQKTDEQKTKEARPFELGER